MAIEGVNEWEERKKKGLMSQEGFHLDPSKIVDSTEELFEKLGPNGAFDELAGQLPPDTDPEIVRQLKLILNKVMKQSQH